MKLMLISVVATTLIAGALSTASAAVRDQREARGDRIEALYKMIRSGRLSRNDRITAVSKVLSLEAEVRKELRDRDRRRDKYVALKRRGLR